MWQEPGTTDLWARTWYNGLMGRERNKGLLVRGKPERNRKYLGGVRIEGIVGGVYSIGNYSKGREGHHGVRWPCPVCLLLLCVSFPSGWYLLLFEGRIGVLPPPRLDSPVPRRLCATASSVESQGLFMNDRSIFAKYSPNARQFVP